MIGVARSGGDLVAAVAEPLAVILLCLPRMKNLMVQKFMTHLPHTIRHDQNLAAAHKLMRTHDIRHLPVLREGRLTGIVSQRDLYLIESLNGIDMTMVPVADAMTTDTYTVGPHTSVRKIAEEMATHRYGSAVVVDGEAIVGIFTTTDALAVLHGVLDAMSHSTGAEASRNRGS
jgi:acetoin utilization protein AcuB